MNIRRGTNFDSKALYYLPSASSLVELQDFGKVLLSTLHPACIEYYRDLSKHARRKRNRNNVPPPTVPPSQGSASNLSLQGWNVRYEFKLAVFAEFRQEMEAACRSYEAAYEGLFGPELSEVIPASSSRFNEARLLADIVAIRIIRCFLWSSQTAAAVKWWIKHRNHVQKLVERRDVETANYRWDAWQSTWSQTMAELIERSAVFSSALPQLSANIGLPVQLPSSRDATSQEGFTPWEHLHHEGYWLNNMRKHIEARRKYASQTLTKNQPVAEGGFLSTSEAPERSRTTINKSIDYFKRRGQVRMVEMLNFYLYAEDCTNEAWQDAVSGLKPLWHQATWRQQGWWILFRALGVVLLRAARELEDNELCLLLIWELSALERPGATSALVQEIGGPAFAAADLTASLPQIMLTFAFGVESGHVGEKVVAQLSLRCVKEKLPLGLGITVLKIMFEGGMSPVLIAAKEGEVLAEDILQTMMTDVSLQEINAGSETEVKRSSLIGTSYWAGDASFRLQGKHEHVYTMHVVPREAGFISVASVVMVLGNGSQELTLNTLNIDGADAVWWETRAGRPTPRPFGMQRDVTTVNVLPKPPKLVVMLPNIASTYYTNEQIELTVEVLNGEEEAVVNCTLQVRLIGQVKGDIQVQWTHNTAPAKLTEGSAGEAVQTLPIIELSQMKPQETKAFVVMMSGLSESVNHEFDVQVSYALESDPAITLTKKLVAEIAVVRPFEITTSFLPRVHESTWPDFFTAPAQSNQILPMGLAQRYLIRADITLLAHGELSIGSVRLVTRRIIGDAVCSSSRGRTNMQVTDEGLPEHNESTVRLSLEEAKPLYFDLEMQKLVLGDRQPVAVDLTAEIEWSRTNSEYINTSILPIPRFLTSMSEPRVLMQASRVEGFPEAYLLTYTIENPSMHFLTFNITMDGGEGLAFSGPKMKNINLVPISRHSIQYRIYVQRTNDWTNVNLQVLDTFFGQTLKIQPASDGIRIDKQGNVQIWLGG